jgi:hypothetical protein
MNSIYIFRREQIIEKLKELTLEDQYKVLREEI